MQKSIQLDKLTLGTCYYPEHWPKDLWENDLDRMLSSGIEIIRIAEFAWSKFEPTENNFTFAFFDEFLTLCQKKGMKVIFCTPSATPPAWLTEKYPETLNAKIGGTLFRHGMRRHYNYNSPKYRELVSRVVTKIAQHYCPHPSIIGWQIDNELNCEVNNFYSESDHITFREYLKQKYKTLENLNEKMGTIFWNQEFTDWNEIHLPRPTPSNSSNPHILLEEKRFISKSTIDFCKFQSDIIRKYAPSGQFITTNGLFGNLDSHEMTDSALDFIVFDNYPNFAFDTWSNPKEEGAFNDRRNSWPLTKARSISPNFGVMEQQSGPGGWVSRMKQPAPKPGQMRLWTYQAIAHGADFISYFRWRTCWVGTEIYWHGLNDYSNEPNRRMAELDTIYKEISSIPQIAGSKYTAKIAMLKDYDNEWDAELDFWRSSEDISDSGWYEAAQLAHTPMDFVYLSNDNTQKATLDDLKKYDLLVYPHPAILTEKTTALLKAYVENGGTLILGVRTGYKDEFGRCPMRPMPGLAAELCGVKVTDYTFIGPDDDTEYAIWDGEKIEALEFNEVLRPCADAEILACFDGNYYNGAPALVKHKFGKGAAYYFGAAFSRNTAGVFLKKLGFANPYYDLLDLPGELELAVRSSDNADYLFILNYKKYPTQFTVKRPMKDLLTGNTVCGETEIGAYGVIILVK